MQPLCEGIEIADSFDRKIQLLNPRPQTAENIREPPCIVWILAHANFLKLPDIVTLVLHAT